MTLTCSVSLYIYIISREIFYERNDCYLNVLCDAIINKIKIDSTGKKIKYH